MKTTLSADDRQQLHQAIMNLPCNPCGSDIVEADYYRYGHRDARHAAAELVLSLTAAPKIDGVEVVSGPCELANGNEWLVFPTPGSMIPPPGSKWIVPDGYAAVRIRSALAPSPPAQEEISRSTCGGTWARTNAREDRSDGPRQAGGNRDETQLD